jgi:hypothetical protein
VQVPGDATLLRCGLDAEVGRSDLRVDDSNKMVCCKISAQGRKVKNLRYVFFSFDYHATSVSLPGVHGQGFTARGCQTGL